MNRLVNGLWILGFLIVVGTLPVLAQETEQESQSSTNEGQKKYSEIYREMHDPKTYSRNYNENYAENLRNIARRNRNARFSGEMDITINRESTRGDMFVHRVPNEPDTTPDNERSSPALSSPSPRNIITPGISPFSSINLLRPPLLMQRYLSGQYNLASTTETVSATESARAPVNRSVLPESKKPSEEIPDLKEEPPVLRKPSELMLQRGLEEFRLRRYAGALRYFEDYRKVTELEPKEKVAYGFVLFANRKYEDAATVFGEIGEQYRSTEYLKEEIAALYRDPKEFETQYVRYEASLRVRKEIESVQLLRDIFGEKQDAPE